MYVHGRNVVRFFVHNRFFSLNAHFNERDFRFKMNSFLFLGEWRISMLNSDFPFSLILAVSIGLLLFAFTVVLRPRKTRPWNVDRHCISRFRRQFHGSSTNRASTAVPIHGRDKIRPVLSPWTPGENLKDRWSRKTRSTSHAGVGKRLTMGTPVPQRWTLDGRG